MAQEAKPEDEVSAVSHEILLDAFDALFYEILVRTAHAYTVRT
jgi:hypothetical protein